MQGSGRRPRSTPPPQQTGLDWEDRASRYLKQHGVRVLKRRYRCRVGELDLVCLDGTTLVIVEVRARSAGRLVDAAETVDRKKRAKLVQATRHLLMTHPHWREYPVRFDVFSVDAIDSTPSIRWVRNAFEAAVG